MMELTGIEGARKLPYEGGPLDGGYEVTSVELGGLLQYRKSDEIGGEIKTHIYRVQMLSITYEGIENELL